jgi:RNA polymerase sigma-70 factor (ECF subfamily)
VTPPIGQDYTALLDRVRRGDARALEDLLDQAQGIARRYSEAVCGRAPDAEDDLQEALISTFRHAGSIRQPGAFRAWLYRTVKNACLVGRRRAAAAPRHLESLEDALVEPADARPAADEVVATLESRRRIQRALEALPGSQREVVFLRDLEGLSTREVARVLGISEANVKVRLHRAHGRLRAVLEQRDGQGEAEAGPLSTARRGARAASFPGRRSP